MAHRYSVGQFVQFKKTPRWGPYCTEGSLLRIVALRGDGFYDCALVIGEWLEFDPITDPSTIGWREFGEEELVEVNNAGG